MSQRSDESKGMMQKKSAEKAGRRLISAGMPRIDVDRLYVGAITRIEEGNFDKCQVCHGAMLLFTTTEEQFLSTTCSEKCAAILAEDDEEGLLSESSIMGDLLPKDLQITAKLNGLQYGLNKTATIIAADIGEVEDRGINAMVTVSHNYHNIPTTLRIAAFAVNDQSAIVKSLIDETTIEEARRSIVRSGMAKAATMKVFSSNTIAH